MQITVFNYQANMQEVGVCVDGCGCGCGVGWMRVWVWVLMLVDVGMGVGVGADNSLQLPGQHAGVGCGWVGMVVKLVLVGG